MQQSNILWHWQSADIGIEDSSHVIKENDAEPKAGHRNKKKIKNHEVRLAPFLSDSQQPEQTHTIRKEHCNNNKKQRLKLFLCSDAKYIMWFWILCMSASQNTWWNSHATEKCRLYLNVFVPIIWANEFKHFRARKYLLTLVSCHASRLI